MSPVNPAFLAALALFACAATAARAQMPGEVDLSFDSGSFVNSAVHSVVPAEDDKVYIAGYFTTVRGAVRNRIARLNADGSADAGFDPGSGTNGSIDSGVNGLINSVALQTDGKVLIGGDFTSYNGVARRCIARLNSDGSLDTSFNPGSGTSYRVQSVTVQADGKVLIGGSFSSYNGVARNRIARLNANGSLDTSFNPGSGASGTVYSVALRADGKVLIGGSFSSCNGLARNRIARLNANGSLDTGFALGSGTNYGVSSVASQADGKVLIGGWFTSNNGVARSSIARLNGDGSPTQASILEAEHPTLGHRPRLQACALLYPLTWRLRAHYLLSSLNAADALTLSTER